MRQILAAAAAALVLWFTVPTVSGVAPDRYVSVTAAMPDPMTVVLLLGALGLIVHCTRRRRESFLQSFIRRKN